MGTLRWKKAYLEIVPIPRVEEQKRLPVANLVSQILSSKAKDWVANVDDLERNIEQLTYNLYGLTREEIESVELSGVL